MPSHRGEFDARGTSIRPRRPVGYVAITECVQAPIAVAAVLLNP